MGAEDTCQKIADILRIDRKNLDAYADYLSLYVSKPNTSNSKYNTGCSIKSEEIQTLQKRSEILDSNNDEEYDRLKRRDYLSSILNDPSFENMALNLMKKSPELREWMLNSDIYTDFDDEIRVKELLQKQRELKSKWLGIKC